MRQTLQRVVTVVTLQWLWDACNLNCKSLVTYHSSICRRSYIKVNMRFDATHVSVIYASQRQPLSSFDEQVPLPWTSHALPTQTKWASDCSQLSLSDISKSSVPIWFDLLLLFHTQETQDVFHCQRTNVGIIGARAEFRWEFPSALEIHKHYAARRHVYNGKWNRVLFAKRTFLMRLKLRK